MSQESENRAIEVKLLDLKLGLQARNPGPVVATLVSLVEPFRKAVEVDYATQNGFFDSLRECLSSGTQAVRHAAALVVSEGISTLVKEGDTALRRVKLVSKFLTYLRAYVAAVPEDPEDADSFRPALRAMLRTSQGALTFKRVLLDSFPLTSIKNLNFLETLPSAALHELSEIIENLCEGASSYVKHNDVLSLAGRIANSSQVGCDTVNKICARAHGIIALDNGLPLKRFVLRHTTLIRGTVSHCKTPGLGCRRACLKVLVAFITGMISTDRELNSSLVCQGSLSIISEALTEVNRGHERKGASMDGRLVPADAIIALSRCFSGGPSFVDAVQNHQLLNPFVSMLTHCDAEVREGVEKVLEEFLKVAKGHNLARAVEMGLLDCLFNLLTYDDIGLHQIVLCLFEKTLERAVPLEKEELVKDRMRQCRIHLILPQFVNSANPNVKQLASALNSRLGGRVLAAA